jgi:hypothetical protein
MNRNITISFARRCRHGHEQGGGAIVLTKPMG